MAQPFPFAAIVAQEDMKEALLMAAVEPLLGGVLIFGDRGTGKSTAVRALTELLPSIETRVGCRYNCLPAEPQSACPVCNPATGQKPPPMASWKCGSNASSLRGRRLWTATVSCRFHRRAVTTPPRDRNHPPPPPDQF